MRISLMALLVSLLLAVAFGQGKSPCHGDKTGQGAGVTCARVVIPPKLCKKCKLKPFNPIDGRFLNCKSIYDIENEECRDALREYARLNKHCDPVRKRQVVNFTPQDVEGLDYFVYSICEECCDCIPFGSKPNNYAGAKAAGKLVVPDRGNCPAHAIYDICKVLPNIRYVVSPGESGPASLPPKICPILATWIRSPAAIDWAKMGMVRIPKTARKFLTRFLNVAKCKNRAVWEECARLEKAQDRLGF